MCRDPLNSAPDKAFESTAILALNTAQPDWRGQLSELTKRIADNDEDSIIARWEFDAFC